MHKHMIATIFIVFTLQWYVAVARPTVEKEYIAKYKENLVIDCKFTHNATEGVVNNVRLSSDKSKILAYINGQNVVTLTGNYKETAAKLTMSIERRAPNHLRIYFEEVPRSLNNVSVLCYTTNDKGMGSHLMEIKNVILLMQAPKIDQSSFLSSYVLREGDLKRPDLTCNASGLPAPVVEWYGPMNRLLASSDDWGRGSSTIIGGVTRRSVKLRLGTGPVKRQWAGVYRCDARLSSEDQRRVRRNPEDRKETRLSVLYPPSVSMTERVVYTDVGANEEVKINVDANPQPKVRCGLVNMPSPKLVTAQQTGLQLSRHTVPLLRIQPSDVGLYRCNASNPMGADSITFSLSITPPEPTILSTGGLTQYSDYYNLRWATDSRARLRNVTASIRVKQQNGTFVNLRKESKKLDVLKGTFDFHLTNLTHNSEHEVRARVCSHHACSPYSSAHVFRTRLDNEGSYTVHPNVYRAQAISEGSRSGPPGSGGALRPPSGQILVLLIVPLSLHFRQ